MLRKLTLPLILVAVICMLSGCSLTNKKGTAKNDEDDIANEFGTSSYKRNGGLLKGGVDPQARAIEERLGVNRGSNPFQ